MITNITFAESGDKQFWAPWERGNDRDALFPSDGLYSWWTAEYLMGAEVMPATDRVIAEMATVLDPHHDVGVSFIPSPANPPALPTWLNISGGGSAAQWTGPMGDASAASCSVSLTRQVSSTRCIEGKTFGCMEGNESMWAGGGCNGEFLCEGHPNVACAGTFGRRSVCLCDTPVPRDCKIPTDCPGPGWFGISRHHLRFGDGAAPHVFDT